MPRLALLPIPPAHDWNNWKQTGCYSANPYPCPMLNFRDTVRRRSSVSGCEHKRNADVKRLFKRCFHTCHLCRTASERAIIHHKFAAVSRCLIGCKFATDCRCHPCEISRTGCRKHLHRLPFYPSFLNKRPKQPDVFSYADASDVCAVTVSVR